MNLTDFYALVESMDREILTRILNGDTEKTGNESEECYQKLKSIADEIGWGEREFLKAIELTLEK